MTQPLTWDDWCKILLRHGWCIYDGSLMSPTSPSGVHCSIVDRGADGLLFHVHQHGKYLTPENPSTIYQMMSLLHGLKICILSRESKPVSPPPPPKKR